MRFAILTEDRELAIRTRHAMSERYGGARIPNPGGGEAETTEWGIAADYEVISYSYHWQPPPNDLIQWGDSTEESVAVVVENSITFVENPNL